MSVPSPAPIVNNYKLQDRYVAHLVTDFTFTKFSCAAQFINDISSICRIRTFNFSFRLNLCIHSKHHPSTFTLHNHGRSSQLTLYLQTIQAFRPRWNQEDPSANPPCDHRLTRGFVMVTFEYYCRWGDPSKTSASDLVLSDCYH